MTIKIRLIKCISH